MNKALECFRDIKVCLLWFKKNHFGSLEDNLIFLQMV